jgi:CMP-N,N'-diacetyllegionaminic acid synthase
VSNFAIIPARGGSKGVPGKNLRNLGGKPLVAHSITSALASGVFEQIHVTTEDAEIARVARELGAVVIDRPTELAGDLTLMPPVIDHALTWYESRHGVPDHIFLLQPTSPFRSAEDIETAAQVLAGDADSVMAVFEPEDPPHWALRSGDHGYLVPDSPLALYLARRQDLPKTYFDGPLYAIETSAFRRYRRFLTDRTRFFVVPSLRALDIDSEFDFRFAEFLLQADRERLTGG